MKLLYTKLIALGSWIFARAALAQSTRTGGEISVSLEGVNPLKTTSITALLDRVIGYLMVIASPIVAIMVIVGAFQILTAGGDPEKFKTGKKTILYAVIGFAIVLLARGLIAILHQLLGVQQEATIPTQSAF